MPNSSARVAAVTNVGRSRKDCTIARRRCDLVIEPQPAIPLISPDQAQHTKGSRNQSQASSARRVLTRLSPALPIMEHLRQRPSGRSWLDAIPFIARDDALMLSPRIHEQRRSLGRNRRHDERAVEIQVTLLAAGLGNQHAAMARCPGKSAFVLVASGTVLRADRVT